MASAAATRAPNSRGSPVSSGCHCTPTANPRGSGVPAEVASSTASTVPSAAHAVAASPWPSRSIAWWWCVATSIQCPSAAGQPECRRPRAPGWWPFPARAPAAGSSGVENAADQSGGADADRVPAEAIGDAGMLLVPDDVREVLVQRPAPDDAEQLHAAADGQQRQPRLQRAVDHGQFPGVALGVGCPGRRVHGGAVPGRIDVAAARHHQAVEVGHGEGGLRGGAAGRQQDRPAAAAAYRVHVRARQDGGRCRPVAPLGDVVVGRDADQRGHGNRSYLGRSGRAGSGGAASGSPG